MCAEGKTVCIDDCRGPHPRQYMVPAGVLHDISVGRILSVLRHAPRQRVILRCSSRGLPNASFTRLIYYRVFGCAGMYCRQQL